MARVLGMVYDICMLGGLFLKRWARRDSALSERGFTAVEVVLSVLISVFILGSLVLFVTRGVAITREQFRQVRTTEDARVQMERVGDALRNARGINDGPWLVDADEYSITVDTNIDDDETAERVRYFLQGQELRRGVSQEESLEVEVEQVLAKTVKNTGVEEPIFTYYDFNDEEIPIENVTSSNVRRVGLTLRVDAGSSDTVALSEVATILFPRGVSGGGPVESLWQGVIHLPGSPPANGVVRVTLTDPATGVDTDETISLVSLNDGRLKTFTEGHYTNINYQPAPVGGDLPDWYAWVGPIFVGKSGEQSYYVTDKMVISDVCTGADLSTLLTTCGERTVTQAGFSESYRPILTYTSESLNAVAYVRDILFDGP